MAGIQYAGEFTLDKCDLITASGGKVDIKALVVEVNIFEDIYRSGMTGTVGFMDTNNVFSKGHVRGQDYIVLKISTPTLSENSNIYIDQTFTVNKVEAKFKAGVKAEFVQLHFVSNEVLKNVRHRISKAYEDTPTKIIENIFRDEKIIASKKPLYIEHSTGVKRVIFPSVRPFDAIKQMLLESVSSKNNSPHYFFFENSEGYHCRTLQNMLDQPTVADFNHGDDDAVVGGTTKLFNVEEDLKKLITFEVNRSIDMLVNTATGVLSSKLDEINIFNKSFNEKVVNYFEDFLKHARIDENPIYSDAPIQRDGKTVGDFPNAKTFLHAVSEHDGQDKTHYNTNTESYSFSPSEIGKSTFLDKQSKNKELFTMLKATASANGNVTIGAGKCVNVRGVFSNLNETDMYDGKYLIIQLRHQFDIGTKKHETIFTIVKDSLGEEVPKNGSIEYEEYESKNSGTFELE